MKQIFYFIAGAVVGRIISKKPEPVNGLRGLNGWLSDARDLKELREYYY